jgi:hypothetical protein
VVDAEGQLLGLVSEGDLIRHLGTEHSKRKAWSCSRKARIWPGSFWIT